jgi:hypothetical protein
MGPAPFHFADHCIAPHHSECSCAISFRQNHRGLSVFERLLRQIKIDFIDGILQKGGDFRRGCEVVTRPSQISGLEFGMRADQNVVRVEIVLHHPESMNETQSSSNSESDFRIWSHSVREIQILTIHPQLMSFPISCRQNNNSATAQFFALFGPKFGESNQMDD